MGNDIQRGIAAAITIAVLSLAVANQSRAGPEKSSAKPMRIGVIRAGSLGRTVGRLLAQAGYEVKFSSRHPEELAAMARELGPRASVGTPREAAEFGRVLLFAVPYEALPQLGRDLKDDIRGKIVLDACNTSSKTDSALVREVQANGAGLTSAKLLPDTRLVRALWTRRKWRLRSNTNAKSSEFPLRETMPRPCRSRRSWCATLVVNR
jgi:predicted dinucleotide-binding enzyme